MRTRAILITGAHKKSQLPMFDRTQAPFDTLETVSEDRLPALYGRNSYDLVIIDATSVESTSVLLARLRREWPRVRLVVATPQPRWESARTAYENGANQYMRVSENVSKFRAELASLLDTGEVHQGLRHF